MKPFQRRPQLWVLSYFFLYLPWFLLLEARPLSECTIIRLPIDDLIPFCEYFIIPYLLWFLYMALAILWFLFTLPKGDFYRFSALLFGGMTVCLLLYTVFYTGLDLRADIDPEKNLCSRLVFLLRQADTSTNVCPSIHCYSTLAIQSAFTASGLQERRPALYLLLSLLSCSILLSTLFLKQHSLLDVVCAAGLLSVMHRLIYRTWPACFRPGKKAARSLG